MDREVRGGVEWMWQYQAVMTGTVHFTAMSRRRWMLGTFEIVWPTSTSEGS